MWCSMRNPTSSSLKCWRRSSQRFLRSRANFTSALKNWLLRRLWICNEISCLLRVDPKRVRLVPHHVSHAAQAFLTSPFESAAILTMDAVGEWACTAISKGESTGEGREIKIVESIPYPHSIGLVFSAFTAFLGFQPNGGEANTMALAAFGRPTYAGQIREILRSSQDGLYTVDVQFFNFLDSAKTLFTKSFIDVFGRPRDLRSKLPFAVSGDSSPSTDDQRFADVAASVQLVLEETVLALARRARRITGSTQLCVAGGVALNAVANSKVIEASGFEDVFVPPDPGDGGAALGAALHEYYRLSASRRCLDISPFLGKSYPDNSISWARGMRFDTPGRRRSPLLLTSVERDIAIEEFDCDETLTQSVAKELACGRIVGWFKIDSSLVREP